MERGAVVRIVFTVILVALIATPAVAECRHLFRVHHQAHHVQAVVQPYVVHQNIFYSVGESLIQQSKIEREVERQVAAKLQQIQSPTAQQQVTGATLNRKCLSCHNGTRDDTDFDLRNGIDNEHFRQIVGMLGEGIGVPEKMKGVIKSLTAEDKGAITSEMLRLPTKPAEPQEGRLE